MKWPFTKTIEKQVALPLPDKWLDVDQKTLSMFLRSQTGRKMFEILRHKLFSEHLEACQLAGNAEVHNASMKGANNQLSHLLYLSTEDSISASSADKEQTSEADQRESVDERRARI